MLSTDFVLEPPSCGQAQAPGLKPLELSCEQVWFLQDGPWSVFSSNQPLKSCWFGQILLNIQRLKFEKHIFGGLCCSVGWGMRAEWPVHQKERWGGKGTVCMNAEQFLPWLCPVQSYQAGNSASPWVCLSLGRCNQEEMKVPNCASCTILPLHRLSAFANEANSRSSP